MFYGILNLKQKKMPRAGDLYKYTSHQMTQYRMIIIANQPI